MQTIEVDSSTAKRFSTMVASPTHPASHLRADAHYSGPPGAHLGPGRILNDGTLDRSKGNTLSPTAVRNSIQSQAVTKMDNYNQSPHL